MKFRPEFAISEQQLIAMLAATGRTVTRGELAAWRDDDLLPPLASHGLGVGKGKSYYWREADIGDRALLVHDCLRKHGRPNEVLLTVWLSGFLVPLPRLRRAWLNRCRQRQALTLRPIAHCGTPDMTALVDGDADVSSLLLQGVLRMGAAIEADTALEQAGIVALLERALQKLGVCRGRNNDPGLAEQIWHLLIAILPGLETSLIREAGDVELRLAQRYLHTAVLFLESCSDDGGAGDLTETLGPPLFLLILALLRSDQGLMLDRMVGQMKDMDRPAGPAHVSVAV